MRSSATAAASHGNPAILRWEVLSRELSSSSNFADPPTDTSPHAHPCGYPPPLALYPYWVFSHPGILHRNSGLESRTRALVLAATLKRRDCLFTGASLGACFLGSSPLTATRSRDAAKRVDRRSSRPSSLARYRFRRHEVVWAKRPKHRLIHVGVWAEMPGSPHRTRSKRRAACNRRAICPSQSGFRVTHNPWVLGSSPTRPTIQVTARSLGISPSSRQAARAQTCAQDTPDIARLLHFVHAGLVLLGWWPRRCPVRAPAARVTALVKIAKAGVSFAAATLGWPARSGRRSGGPG